MVGYIVRNGGWCDMAVGGVCGKIWVLVKKMFSVTHKGNMYTTLHFPCTPSNRKLIYLGVREKTTYIQCN